MTRDDYAHIQRLQGQISMLTILLIELANIGGNQLLLKKKAEDMRVHIGQDDPANEGMEAARQKLLSLLK